ncbi:hypothetical protein GQ44DRAFT_723720 [Phaeosphaeriaceae sp. PMI808]|nr:hypothetical protein GQ44DRAFT_723720 [Phaeosphaeriaceae sp. PMI808]
MRLSSELKSHKRERDCSPEAGSTKRQRTHEAKLRHRQNPDPPNQIQRTQQSKRTRDREHPHEDPNKRRHLDGDTSPEPDTDAVQLEYGFYLRPAAQEDILRWQRANIWHEVGMEHLLARKPSSVTLRRERSGSNLAASETTTSDEKLSEEQSAPYRNPNYYTFLSESTDYKSYMTDHELGLSAHSKELLDKLRKNPQVPPESTIFHPGKLRKHLDKLKGKNESRILQDISHLLVPSAETLASLGEDHLTGIVESVNEGWTNCIPITKPRPQPDSAFGYGKFSFSENQLDALRPALGDATMSSWFKATYYMYFTFLAKEVKTGSLGLDIADNQNGHSMTIAVRAVVKLFTAVGREQELHREIVAFAVSHDDQSVRLYAYYPAITGGKVTIWRHTIKKYYLDDDTMWTAWSFTKNVYDIFNPLHINRIHSAIDDLCLKLRGGTNSGLENAVTSTLSESSGISQSLEAHSLNGIAEAAPGSQKLTPNTSIPSEPKSPQSPQRKRSKHRTKNMT